MMEWERLFIEKMEAMRIPLQKAGKYMDDHNDCSAQPGVTKQSMHIEVCL